MSLKVLPLDVWMSWKQIREQDATPCNKAPLGFNARYYDRHENYCWFEYDGVCYEDSSEGFLYKLELTNMQMLTISDYERAKKLLRCSTGITKKVLQKVIKDHEILKELNLLIMRSNKNAREMWVRIHSKLKENENAL